MENTGKGKIPCDVGSNSIRRSFKTAMISDLVIDALAYFQLHSSDFSDLVRIGPELVKKMLKY